MSLEDAIACGKRDHMLGPHATRVLIAEVERLSQELRTLRKQGPDAQAGLESHAQALMPAA